MAYSRPGRSQAGKLTGLLGSIGDTIGEMGAPGEQYVDTFRRSMAPEADMNSSDSLLNYADWARRNGYEDEAKTYLALGYKRKAVEGEKSYKTRVAGDKVKLRGYNESIGRLEQELAVANEQANPQAPYIEAALGKVKGARRSLVTGLNEYGAANDYGVGDEGTKSSMALQAEAVAAEKAAMERRQLLTSIQAAEVELEDAVAASTPINSASLPANLRGQYESLVQAAMEGPMPRAQMAELNSKWSQISADYLAKRSDGDQATQQLLWTSARNIRKDVDSDVQEWMADSDNQEAIARAVETAEAQLLQDDKYLTASPETQAVMAQDALLKILRGQRADLDELYEDAEKDAKRDVASQEARAKRVTEDRDMKYDPGMEPGGAEYKRARANAEKAKGESFDPEAFDASWDRRFFNPWGITKLPAPIY